MQSVPEKSIHQSMMLLDIELTDQMLALSQLLPFLLGSIFRTMNPLESMLVQPDNTWNIGSYQSELSSANYCHSYSHPQSPDDVQ